MEFDENSLDPRAKHEHFFADDIQDLVSSRGDEEASNVPAQVAAASCLAPEINLQVSEVS